DGICHLQDAAKAVFYSDLSPLQQDLAASKWLRAHSRASLCAFPQFLASDITTIPKIYVLCEKDKTLDPAHQEMFINIGKFDRVVRLPEAGHTPSISQPGSIVDIVLDVAGR
ncbi:hypothetical protein QQS21_011066, partial [Conoideocrella luteorostrata]